MTKCEYFEEKRIGMKVEEQDNNFWRNKVGRIHFSWEGVLEDSWLVLVKENISLIDDDSTTESTTNSMPG